MIPPAKIPQEVLVFTDTRKSALARSFVIFDADRGHIVTGDGIGVWGYISSDLFGSACFQQINGRLTEGNTPVSRSRGSQI